MIKQLHTTAITIAFSLSILSVGCGHEQSSETLPFVESSTLTEVTIENDITQNFNEVITGSVNLKEAEDYFVSLGYPSFLPMVDKEGYKSVHDTGNVIYLYSSDNDTVDNITYRYFVNGDAFDDTTITSGINEIASMISLVLGRDIAVDERKQVKELYSEMIEQNSQKETTTLTLDTLTFTFSVEPLSMSLICSYDSNKH